jgi:hypothetical protein
LTAKRWGAPLAVAIVVALVAGVAVWLARDSSSTPRPVVLHLGSAAGGVRAMAATVPTDESPAPVPVQQPYKLIGTLPDGQPADAPVYRLPKATGDDAATVARALHLEGMPVRADGGWVVRDGSNRLAVRDDGSWSYGLDCFSGPEAKEELTVECAYASGGGVAIASPATTSGSGSTGPADQAPPPVPTPSVEPGPSESTARAVAQDAMTALGYDSADIVVNAADPMAYVQATPQVDGQPAIGWTMSFAVKADGSIDNANGWIGSPRSGASYPLITATDAFDLLQQQPRPMMDLCMVRKDGKPGCADMPPTEIMGASLGLALDYESDKPILVPAWLFSVKDQDMPVSQVAIDPKYIAAPSPEPVPVVKGVPAPAQAQTR